MKKYILILAAVLSLASCKEYLDINYDPNSASPDMVSNNEILPAAEMALSATYGNFFRITGGFFSEQYAHFFGTSNYVDYSQFTMSQTRSSTAYSQLMQGCIANATVVRDNAAEAGEWGTYLAAVTLRVFAFQALVDAYGEIPYTEAMNPDEFPNPKYDDGQVVYNGLVDELEDALSKAKSGDDVATNFLYSGQDASNWIKFANALEFKLLMREGATEKAAQVIARNNFPTADVAWAGFWSDASGKANPFYQEEFALYFGSTQINCALNVALYKTMSDCNDARLQAFFSPNTSGAYWGSISGYNMSTSDNYKSGAFCRPNMKYDSPVYLITLSEIDFFLSEYYQKTGDAAKAKQYYEAGVKDSFATAKVGGAAAVLSAWPYDSSLKSIGIQKWVALSGTNNYEAWCELRRLGYPAFSGLSADKLYIQKDDNLDASGLPSGTLYTPWLRNSEVGDNATIQRWPYALGSTNANLNAPDVKKLNEKVFWAK